MDLLPACLLPAGPCKKGIKQVSLKSTDFCSTRPRNKQKGALPSGVKSGVFKYTTKPLKGATNSGSTEGQYIQLLKSTEKFQAAAAFGGIGK